MAALQLRCLHCLSPTFCPPLRLRPNSVRTAAPDATRRGGRLVQVRGAIFDLFGLDKTGKIIVACAMPFLVIAASTLVFKGPIANQVKELAEWDVKEYERLVAAGVDEKTALKLVLDRIERYHREGRGPLKKPPFSLDIKPERPKVRRAAAVKKIQTSEQEQEQEQQQQQQQPVLPIVEEQ